MSKVSKKKLYMCSTPYHLLYTLVRETNYQNEVYIYLSSYDQNIINYYRKVLKESTFNKVVFSTRKRRKIEDYLFFGFFKDRLEYKKLVSKNSIDEVIIFPWNIKTLYIHVNYFFKKHKNITFIEDGITAYQAQSKNHYFAILKKYFYRICDSENYHKVNKLFVNDTTKYNEEIFGICQIYQESFEDMFKLISDKDKEKIFSFFNNETTNMENDKELIDKKSIIILTQPLSEDGYEKENDKKEMYMEIADKYLLMNYFVYLKKHPRDLSEYSFENDKKVIVLDKFLPSELLAVNNITFDIALGICTSAINNINANEKINLKPDYFYDR